MSQEAGYSPSFKRPTEIMRMSWKRTRNDAGVLTSPSGQDSTGSLEQSKISMAGLRPFLHGPRFVHQNHLTGGVKRRNPFSNIENTFSPKKKLHINNHEGNTDDAETLAEKVGYDDLSTKEGYHEGISFSRRLLEVTMHREQDKSSQKGPTVAEDVSLFDEYEDVESHMLKSPQASVSSPITSICTEYPADWSIKTCLLFTSPHSLSWTENLKAQEEALSLSQHCRAKFSTLAHTLQDPRSCSELRCAFQQSLIYWQHPSISWLSLFPRINAERSFTGKSTPWAQDTALQHSLMTEWSVSLSSLYSLLKNKLCPYFYVCSHQFTVLFRAAGLCGSGCISAVISPTTRGLREAMKAEGIEFNLPLMEEKCKSREQTMLTDAKEKEDGNLEKKGCSNIGEIEEFGDAGDRDNEDEDSSFSWLKEMGVQDKIKKPDSIKMQLHKEGHMVSLDHKPESVVYVEGTHTFTLINFLINCKSLVAVAGSQAGLPPTLLAPVSFRGASMHLLKAHSVNVRSQIGSSYQNISSLEISGPILPSALHTITTLLRLAQRGNFSASLYTHAPTAVMNVHSSTQQSSDGSVDLSCGVHPLSLQQLQQPSTLGKTALTRISMCNHSYTWKN